MTVAELIAILQKLPTQDAKLELPDGNTIDDVWYHQGMKRVSLDTEDARPNVVTPGWTLRFREIAK
jgi:hypothetical protein